MSPLMTVTKSSSRLTTCTLFCANLLCCVMHAQLYFRQAQANCVQLVSALAMQLLKVNVSVYKGCWAGMVQAVQSRERKENLAGRGNGNGAGSNGSKAPEDKASSSSKQLQSQEKWHACTLGVVCWVAGCLPFFVQFEVSRCKMFVLTCWVAACSQIQWNFAFDTVRVIVS